MTTTVSVRKPEDVILCEEQEENYCGRHVLRALTQRCDLFSEEYLLGIAQNLASDEQAWRDERGKFVTDYCYKKSGEYYIQYLQLALRDMFNVDLIRISNLSLEEESCPIRNLIYANIQHAQAMLIRDDHHYYCVRRFRLTEEYFFIIDSKHLTHHHTIHREHILGFLHTLMELRCDICVIIQHISDEINEEVSVDNIEAKLWALPDALADCEVLIKSTQFE